MSSLLRIWVKYFLLKLHLTNNGVPGAFTQLVVHFWLELGRECSCPIVRSEPQLKYNTCGLQWEIMVYWPHGVQSYVDLILDLKLSPS